MKRSLVLLVLPLMACGGLDDPDQGFAEALDDPDGIGAVEETDDLDAPDDPVEPADDDDSADLPEGDGWDASPPPAEPGDSVYGVIRCGWLTGDLQVGWSWAGDVWQELNIAGESGPRPELEPCFEGRGDPADNHRLHWRDDGTMYFAAGGLDHFLAPVETERTWMGEVRPIGGPSPACLEAVAAAGLELPVIMTLRLEPPVLGGG